VVHRVSAGSLEVGKLAELRVRSKNYMLVSVDQVGGIKSVVTMVGGKVVFAADRFKQWEQ
jgi:predicted amidohydrolase YtcJ